MKSKQARLLTQLQAGAELTSRQISVMTGLKNPHSAIKTLREQGHCIYGNVATVSGTSVKKYRIGKPTKKMVSIANRIFGASAFTN